MSRWSPDDVRRAQLAAARKDSGLHRVGRPRSEYPLRYQVRHTAEQRAAWAAAAKAEGRTLQSWIRWHLDRAANTRTP